MLLLKVQETKWKTTTYGLLWELSTITVMQKCPGYFLVVRVGVHTYKGENIQKYWGYRIVYTYKPLGWVVFKTRETGRALHISDTKGWTVLLVGRSYRLDVRRREILFMSRGKVQILGTERSQLLKSSESKRGGIHSIFPTLHALNPIKGREESLLRKHFKKTYLTWNDTSSEIFIRFYQ